MTNLQTKPIDENPPQSDRCQEGAQLGNLTPKGENSYIIGGPGSGKTISMLGVIVNNLATSGLYSTKHSNIVVLDSGRSYEGICSVIGDSQFINLTAPDHAALAPVILSGSKLTVFDLEEIRYTQTEVIINQLISLLKAATTNESLVIIDEWWLMDKAIKRWALTEFEGKTLVSAMTEKDITHDQAYHLFDGGIELSGIKTRRVSR